MKPRCFSLRSLQSNANATLMFQAGRDAPSAPFWFVRVVEIQRRDGDIAPYLRESLVSI